MKLPLREYGDVVTALKGADSKASTAEKRNAARITVSSKITVHLLGSAKVERSFTAFTRDISLTGIGLMQSVALSAKQRVIVILPRPNVAPLYVISTVAVCRPLADGLLAVGLEFSEISSNEACNQLMNDDSAEHARIRESMFR